MAQGMSIACSTPEALKWDPEWAGTHEISGRAMKDVHSAGNDFSVKRCGLLMHACQPLDLVFTSQGRACCTCAEEVRKELEVPLLSDGATEGQF